MTVKIACPNSKCEAEYVLPDEKLGSVATCVSCGQSFTVRMSAGKMFKPPNDAVPQQRPTTEAEAATKILPVDADSPAEPLPFRKLGPYLVRQRLGGGGMGEVWLGRDEDLKRDVAIKTLKLEYARDPEYLQRFMREASSAAQLHHHNTVSIYQVGADGETAYIAMELVDGSSLDKIIKQRGPLPWREATAIIREAAAGLGVAHKKSLVHRDIKPANLMLDQDGVTKVVDFGLARAASPTTAISQPGTLWGTPEYIAPELWNGEPADARSDLYALTLTYYCLLTGHPPYKAEQPIQVGLQHCTKPFPDAGRIIPDLPERLVQILSRGAAKDPSQRYRTATELMADLDALLVLATAKRSPVGDRTETMVEPPPLPDPCANMKHAGQPVASLKASGWATTLGLSGVGMLMSCGFILWEGGTFAEGPILFVVMTVIYLFAMLPYLICLKWSIVRERRRQKTSGGSDLQSSSKLPQLAILATVQLVAIMICMALRWRLGKADDYWRYRGFPNSLDTSEVFFWVIAAVAGAALGWVAWKSGLRRWALLGIAAPVFSVLWPAWIDWWRDGDVLMVFGLAYYALTLPALLHLVVSGIRAKWMQQPSPPRLHDPEMDQPNLEAEIDRILVKVYQQGESSLSSAERKTLEKTSRRYQQRRR